MKTLITSSEVLAHVAGDENLSTQFFETHIAKVEFKYLADNETGCLGLDFYNALIADARTFIQHDSTVPVDLDTVVIYESKLWKSLINANATIPGSDLTKWALVNKFTTAKYQTLWDEHLCLLLSHMVIGASVYKSSFRITNMGVMRHKGDNTSPADIDAVKLLKDEYSSDVDTLFKRMDQYLKHKDRKELFPTYRGNANDCGDGDCTQGRMSLGVFVDTNPRGNFLDDDDCDCTHYPHT